MDHRKTYCLYHPDSIITNFCRDKNCLMPLCPTCIGDHTLYHEENKSKPAYFNIHQTVNDVQNLLHNTIFSLEQDKKRNVDLIKKIQSLDDLIREKILTTKNLVYTMVEQAFIELQKDLKSTLMRLNEQANLFSIKKSEIFDETLSETLDELHTIKSGLKGDKYLGSIIIFLKDKLQESSSFHNKMINYLQANENYEPRLEFSNEAKNAILHNVGRIIKVQNRRGLDRVKERSTESKPSLFKNKNYYGDKNEKLDKLEKSYTPQKSSAYLRTNVESSRSKVNLFTNNSPYRQRLEPASMTYHPSPSRVYPPPGIETNRAKDFRQQYENITRKPSHYRKESDQIRMIK